MCGIFGFFGLKKPLAHAEIGMTNIIHRGHHGAGVGALMRERTLKIRKAPTLKKLFEKITDLNQENILAIIGHTRWPTAGSNDNRNAQPHYKENPLFRIAVASNGDIVNMAEQVKFLHQEDIRIISQNDAEMIAGSIYWQINKLYWLLKSSNKDSPINLGKKEIIRSIKKTMEHIHGAYSALFMADFDQALYAFRDPHGIRPMVLGVKNNSYVICSETCQLDAINANYLREVNPGEIIRVSEDGLESSFFETKTNFTPCVLEMIYFSRPDSLSNGLTPFSQIRHNLGQELGQQILESDIVNNIDLIIPVPRSGNPAGLGVASVLTKSQLRSDALIIKPGYNHGRTFTEHSFKDRAKKLVKNISLSQKSSRKKQSSWLMTP